MTNLSPAAQAVRDAVLATYADNIPKDDNLWALERASTVAALRAAAEIVAPLSYEDVWTDGRMLQYEKYDPIREKLLIIADELEAQ